jgi:hypothetical protein
VGSRGIEANKKGNGYKTIHEHLRAHIYASTHV